VVRRKLNLTQLIICTQMIATATLDYNNYVLDKIVAIETTTLQEQN